MGYASVKIIAAWPMLTTLKSVAAVLTSFGLLFIANGLFNTLLGIALDWKGSAPKPLE